MHHIAQLNVARMRYTLDDSRMREFADALAPVNAVADQSPGFVWRLQSDAGDATALRITDDDRLLVNMSVWESVEALRAFVADPAHLGIMRRREEWFERSTRPYLVLWWIPAGHRPDLDEARGRLEHIRSYGPTAHAFDFARVFDAPDADAGACDRSARGTS